MLGRTLFALTLGVLVATTFSYLAVAGLIHVPEFSVPGLRE